MKDVVIITGATKGIGAYLAQGYHERGYKVYGLDIELNAPLIEEITYLQVDLKNPVSINDAFNYIQEKEENIHILINNAAVANFSKSLIEVELEELDKLVDTNIRGTILCCQEFLRIFKSSYGRIINLGSTRWGQNEINWELYGASKGAIVSLTSSLAVSLMNKPITVNAISPGWICTDNYEKLSKEDHMQHPSGRVGCPEDILKAALYLSDKENDFVNGLNLIVDGGMSKKMIYLD